ncbi:MAG: energy-coupled thiamine transporter ThiT [bacterium]|nr:energy-coupled thiamine transporter ThiT [bacterium]
MSVQKLPLRALAEAGILIALATVLSFVKVFSLPQGGSVTAASMVPILFLALRWGPGLGLLGGVAYGLLQFAVEPFVYHPAQVLLDYPVAFGLLGLAGFFRGQPTLGVAAGIAGRFASHWLAGVVFFAAFAGTRHPAVHSAIYNGSYLLPELVVSAVVMALLARVVGLGVARTE